jgi:hypothetical protein
MSVKRLPNKNPRSAAMDPPPQLLGTPLCLRSIASVSACQSSTHSHSSDHLTLHVLCETIVPLLSWLQDCGVAYGCLSQHSSSMATAIDLGEGIWQSSPIKTSSGSFV